MKTKLKSSIIAYHMAVGHRVAAAMVCALCAVGLSAFAEESVTINEVKSVQPWDKAKGTITVDYSLGGLDTAKEYKVAFDITANGVTKGVTNAAAKLTSGQQTVFTNDTVSLFSAETRAEDAQVKVSLIAIKPPPATVPVDADGFDTTAENVAPYYSTTFIPGDYCVVDLTTGEVTEMKNVQKADTFNTDDYKTTKMAFRWVPAGKFKAVCAKKTGYESLVTNDVTLSACWIAVFHVTEAQFNCVTNGGVACGGTTKPKVSISWNAFRGGTWDGWDGTYANVPAPGDGTFVKALNDKVATAGCADTFDLCTSFQWERSARAGTRTDYFFSDKTVTTAASEDSGDFKALYDYAWFTKNSGKSKHDVGGKSPNAWGLYDVYGNINDWCLDWYEGGEGLDGGKKLEDYVAAIFNSTRVCRGGYYSSSAGYCSSVGRNNIGQTGGGVNHGFRLVRKPAAK